MLNHLWRWTAAACVALSLQSAIVPVSVARAQTAASAEALDTVFLANGGRVRGTVMEEDPAKGVRIRLPDGTVRAIAAKDVKSVSYADEKKAAPPPAAEPAPAPQPAPATAPTTAAASAAPAAVPPATPSPPPDAAEGSTVRMRMKSAPLFGVGLTLGIIGGVVLMAGVITADQAKSSSEKGTDEILAGVGGITLGVGLLMAMIGGKRVPVRTSAQLGPLQVAPVLSPRSAGLVVRF